MNKKKKIIIVSTITCVVVVAVAAMVAFMWSKPINKFNRAVKEGKINQAVRIYNTADYDEQYDMSDSILDKIDEYYNAFLNNDITYDEVVDFLKMAQHIENEAVNEKITIVNSRLNTLYESKKSYSAAVNAYNDGDYAYAYKMYNKVIYEDTYFEKASEGAKDAKKEYIAQVLSIVEVCKAEGNYSKAVSQIRDAIEVIGKSTSLDEEMEICKALVVTQEVEASISEADTYISAGNYVDAIRLLENKEEIYNDDRLISKLTECCSIYSDFVISNIDSAYVEGRYSDAIGAGNVALELLGDITEAENNVKNIRNIMKKIYGDWKDGCIASNDYSSAIKILNNAINVFPDDAVLQGSRQDCINTYIDNVIAAANSAVADRNLELATSICDIAYADVGYDERLISEYEYIGSMQPVYLDELTPVNYDSNMWSKWQYGVTLTDTLGNKYDEYACAIRLGMYNSAYWRGTSQAEYYLGKAYRTISGEIVPENKTSTEGQCQFVIYADDVCVYRSEPITRKSAKISFTADISGAEFIKIICEGLNGQNSCYFYLIDPKLEK